MSTQAQTAAKAGEVSAEYRAHVDRYIARHEPATAGEKLLVRKMADAMWSIHQIRGICDPKRYEKSMKIFFSAYGKLRAIQSNEEREIRELHREQAADFSAYIRSRAR
jgi:hypothetical protein